MATKALAVDRVVNVTINLQPLAASRRNFGVLLIAGASDVIPPAERIRSYTGIDGVASDFGLDAPEYLAAELFFSQSPRPAILQIGRWVKTPCPAMLRGGILTAEEAALARWTAIADGSLTLHVAGETHAVAGLDFSEVTNLNAVASVISGKAASSGVACAWDGERFTLTTLDAGPGATLTYCTDAAEGTAIADALKLTPATALAPQDGLPAETIKECVVELADRGDWYGLAVADDGLGVDDHLVVAQYIQAASKSRIYAATITDTRVLDAAYADDLASRGKALKLSRLFCCYSANKYAAVSAIGRAFTVNFSANRSTITLKFKQLPSVEAEGLTESQANTLAAKRCNVFAAYNNDTAILQEGVMSGDAWFDEIHGTDWLQNAVQTELWNLLYQSKTKVPQTNSGVHQLITCIENVLEQAVNNALVAPGTWNGDGFGQLERGDYLPKGYYVYSEPIELQAQSEREQRKAPPVQCAVKLAGAIHSVDVAINVNR